MQKKNTALRIAVMGGTFDPIHYGHLVTAEAVRAEFKIDQVIFMPTGSPPHKEKSSLSDAEQRYLMTVLATTNNPNFLVSRMEIDRKGTTYTIDTVKELKERYNKNARIFFITGADAVQQILTWRNADELLKLCDFVAVSRPGYTSEELLKEIEKIKGKFASKLHFLEVPALAISSTDIRERVRKGKPITYLLPDSVEKHIMKMDLYSKAYYSEHEILQVVEKALSEPRFTHTLGVLAKAAQLAEKYGGDVKKARIAAILHDYGKEVDNEQKKRLCEKYKIKLDPVMKKQIDLTHSFLSAAMAKEQFGIDDADILNAISYHTTGRKKMSLLEKIIFVADVTEQNRPSYSGLDAVRLLTDTDLDAAVVKALRAKISYTEYKKKLIHPLSEEALDYYTKQREDIE